jgi:hypothetical protein
MDARELIAAARRRRAAGDLVETEKLLRSAISRGKHDSSALFTAQYFLGQLLVQAQASKAEGITCLKQAWEQGIELLQGSTASTTAAARAILHSLCCTLLLHYDSLVEQGAEAAEAVRQQYAEHLATAGVNTVASGAYVCATCKSSITEVSGNVEDDGLWYCTRCIAAYAAEMSETDYSCGTCGASSTNTEGSVEIDMQWYCKPCIAAYELEVQRATAAAASEKDADSTTARVNACCNCSDSTVPLIQTSSQSKLYCEACLQELAESGGNVLRYSAEELRLQQCKSGLSTAALPDSVAAMYARHSIVAVENERPKQSKQKQRQQQQQAKSSATKPADLPPQQQQQQQEPQQLDQQQQQQHREAQNLVSDAEAAADELAVGLADQTEGDDPLL